MAKLNINGKVRDVEVESDTPLLWVIREQVGLTGTKYGCGVAQCGACSVHINGEVVRSCSIPVGTIKATDRIVTIEGLSANRSHPVQKAWLAVDVPQCGYCQSGQIMAAAALLEEEPAPDRQGHRRRDDQHLPMRHLSAHPGGGASRRQDADRRRRPRDDRSVDSRRPAMNKTSRGKTTNLSRRRFLVSSAAAGGGLALGFQLPFAVAEARDTERRAGARRSMRGSS